MKYMIMYLSLIVQLIDVTKHIYTQGQKDIDYLHIEQ